MTCNPSYRFPFFHNKRVHFGISGSIAAYKMPDILRQLLHDEIQISATLTNSGQHFLTPLLLQSLGADPVYTSWFGLQDDPFSHLEPGQSADLLVLAPLSATTLARIAHGLADDLLSNQYLAFSGSVLCAPSMNTKMWNSKAVQQNWQTVKNQSHTLCLEPDDGVMACGDQGTGRLPAQSFIYYHILKALSETDLSSKKILITLGPTREFFDPVRFVSNPSSGTMGLAIAYAAWLRGADVHVVHGPIAQSVPPFFKNTQVTSAQEMYTAANDLWPSIDIAILSAAVSDFAPVEYVSEKQKKRADTRTTVSWSLQPTPDIAATMGSTKKKHQTLVGFAAETSDCELHAREKLSKKNFDLIAANIINIPGQGFASPLNEVLLLDRHDRVEHLPLLRKEEIAWRMLDWITHLLS